MIPLAAEGVGVTSFFSPIADRVPSVPKAPPIGEVKLTRNFWDSARSSASAGSRVATYGGPYDMASVERFKQQPLFQTLMKQYHDMVDQLAGFVACHAPKDLAAAMLPELEALRSQIGTSDTPDLFHSIPPNLLYKDAQEWMDCIKNMINSADVVKRQKLDVLDRMCTGLKNCGDGSANRLETAARASKLLCCNDVTAYAKERMIEDLIIAFVNENERGRGLGETPHLVAAYKQALSEHCGILHPEADRRTRGLDIDSHKIAMCQKMIDEHMTVRRVVDFLASDVNETLKQAYEKTLTDRNSVLMDLDSFGNFYQTEVEPLLQKYALNLPIASLFDECQDAVDDSSSTMVLKGGDATALMVAVQDSLRVKNMIFGNNELAHFTRAEQWVVDGDLAYIQRQDNMFKPEPITPEHLARVAPDLIEHPEHCETIALHAISTWAQNDLSEFPCRWLTNSTRATQLFSRMNGEQLRQYVQSHSREVSHLLRGVGGDDIVHSLAMREMDPVDLRNLGVNLASLKAERPFLLDLIYSGRTLWVEQHAKAGANFRFHVPEWPHYPVAMAVQQGNIEMAKILVNAGSPNPFQAKLGEMLDDSQILERGHGVLREAARSGDVRVLEAAVALMPRSRLALNVLPLFREAAGHGRVEFLKALSKNGWSLTPDKLWGPVVRAVAGGHFDTLVYLASQGALDNKEGKLNKPVTFYSEPDAKPMPMLHFAAQRGYVDIVNLLLTSGADPAITVAGMNAVHYAMINGHPQVLEAFQAHNQFRAATSAQAKKL